jgi:hypothetical protein
MFQKAAVSTHQERKLRELRKAVIKITLHKYSPFYIPLHFGMHFLMLEKL